MSSLLKGKRALASLRAKLEGRRERKCWKCKGFGHRAQHCRKEEKRKRKSTLQDKFEILASRVMRCGVELRKQEAEERWRIKCYKCGEERHKCKECLLWKKVKRVAHPVQGKAHQQEKRKPAYPIKGEVQEGERRFVTNFIWSYLHQFFDDSHGLETSLKPLKRPFNQYQSRLEVINNGRDIRQINW